MKKLLLNLVAVTVILILSKNDVIAIEYDNGDITVQAETLSSLGILRGDEKGNYNEFDRIKREEILVLILRTSEHKFDGSFVLPDKPTFTDVPKSHWAWEEVEKAYYYGITRGIGNNKFGLGGYIHSSHADEFLANMLGIKAEWGSRFVINNRNPVAPPEIQYLGIVPEVRRGHVIDMLYGALFHENESGFWGEYHLKKMGLHIEDRNKVIARRDSVVDFFRMHGRTGTTLVQSQRMYNNWADRTPVNVDLFHQFNRLIWNTADDFSELFNRTNNNEESIQIFLGNVQLPVWYYEGWNYEYTGDFMYTINLAENQVTLEITEGESKREVKLSDVHILDRDIEYMDEDGYYESYLVLINGNIEIEGIFKYRYPVSLIMFADAEGISRIIQYDYMSDRNGKHIR